jgi:hypothetical protein
LHFFSNKFPLPNQRRWQCFHISSEESTHIIACLQMKDLPMEEWRKLTTLGNANGTIGADYFALLGSTLTSTQKISPLKKSSNTGPCSEAQFDLETWVMEKFSKLQQSAQASWPLTRPFPWLPDANPSISRVNITLFLR